VSTAATTHLPTPLQVRELLSGLLGREVTLSPGSPMAPRPGDAVSIATYVDDALVVRATITCDLALSAALGCAIALLPAPQVAEAVEANAVDETLADNLYEVLNVLAATFNVPDAPHVRLHALHPAIGAPPPDARARVLALGRREDLRVEVPGYGEGRLSVVLA